MQVAYWIQRRGEGSGRWNMQTTYIGSVAGLWERLEDIASWELLWGAWPTFRLVEMTADCRVGRVMLTWRRPPGRDRCAPCQRAREIVD